MQKSIIVFLLEYTQAAHYSAVLCCGHEKLMSKINQIVKVMTIIRSKLMHTTGVY